MTLNDIERARLLEHAVENAVGGLSREEWLELRRQVGTAALDQDDALERAAAAIDLARQPKLEPMSRRLAAAVAADADRFFARRRAPAPVVRAPVRPGWFVYGGWIAAAASFVAAVGLVWSDRSSAPPAVAALERPAPEAEDEADTAGEPSASIATGAAGVSGRDVGGEAVAAVREAGDVAAERQALAAQRFVLRRNWAPGGDPAGRDVGGDVVWDARTQTGYMRFVGLRRNDPSSEQYQLWIFDARRDQRYPVDGGVFDVDDSGEAVVPIRARLPVGSPLMFAVTVERPGGVVVSDRSRLVVVARIG